MNREYLDDLESRFLRSRSETAWAVAQDIIEARKGRVFGVVKENGTVEPVVEKGRFVDNGMFMCLPDRESLIKPLPGFEEELRLAVEEKSRNNALKRLPEIIPEETVKVKPKRKKLFGIF